MQQQPLVSIMIPNYNHSKYIEQCIESALNQTYQNLEIIVLDNQSEDDSVKIAASYKTKNIRVCRNCYNILNISYKVLADVLSHGKYMMLLCADDYIHENFVEKAVCIMERYQNIGYVHGERDFITDDNKKIELDPFYKCSFMAPGENDSPIYMVTTVAHPSQGIFRRSAFRQINGYDQVIDHSNADKTLWFYLSQVSDYAYIREKMAGIRIGEQTDTFITHTNFQHPILSHLTIKDFVKYGRNHDKPAIYNRENEALTRLAVDFLEYARGMAAIENWEMVNAYLKYSLVLSRDISKNKKFCQLLQMMQKKKADMDLLCNMEKVLLCKKRGYEPPKNYIEIRMGKEI